MCKTIVKISGLYVFSSFMPLNSFTFEQEFFLFGRRNNKPWIFYHYWLDLYLPKYDFCIVETRFIYFNSVELTRRIRFIFSKGEKLVMQRERGILILTLSEFDINIKSRFN